MPVFTYTAAKRNGEIVKGERESENQNTLAKLLKEEELFLLEAREKGSGKDLLTKLDLGSLSNYLSKFLGVSLVDKMFFTRNLAVMLQAGLALTKALDALAKQSAGSNFSQIIDEAKNSVIKGKTFADSLRLHEKAFGELYINMIEVGEATGKLTLVLKLLANQMKKDHDLRKKVKGAMIYPAIIVTVLIVIGALMMIYVVPQLTATIVELGVELPLLTKIFIGISEFVLNYWWVGLIALAGLAGAFWFWLKTAAGKRIFDRVVLKLPIFGELIERFNTARFCRTLAYLISSGVPIVRSLEITSNVLGNTLFKNAAAIASKEIQEGKQLNLILSAHPIFKPMVIQMIEVGEETGKISEMLIRLSIFFEEEVTETTKNLSSVIEPILMVFIGGAVGLFAVAMLQPIYSSLGNIQ